MKNRSNENDSLQLLFSRIESLADRERVIIAIDGGSASGKTTLAGFLAERYSCSVFHMDDFFLRPNQRTPQRLAEAGGNVDRERFLAEVLLPLSEGRTVRYRPYDCSRQALAEPVEVEPRRLNIVEGAYSMHPELSGYYSLSVFLDVSPQLQRERIRKRNTEELAERFFGEWIPLESLYFDKTSVRDRCDLVIPVGDIKKESNE